MELNIEIHARQIREVVAEADGSARIAVIEPRRAGHGIPVEHVVPIVDIYGSRMASDEQTAPRAYSVAHAAAAGCGQPLAAKGCRARLEIAFMVDVCARITDLGIVRREI